MAGFSNKERPISKFVEKVEERGFVILNALGPIGVAIFLTFISDWWKNNTISSPSSISEFFQTIWLILWNPVFGALVFIALTLIGAVGQARDSKKLNTEITDKDRKLFEAQANESKLKTQINEKEEQLREEVESNYQLAEELVQSYKNLAHLWICQIFNELEFNVKHRISIYYLDGSDNLVLLDRFAKNTDYNSQGRPFFDKNQGVMGKVWSDGVFFEKSIPKFTKKNTQYYKYLEEKYDFTRDVTSRLRMKSLTIGGFAIEDAQGHHIGVIIFESLDPDDFENQKLENLVKRENYRLVQIISDTSVRDLRPTRKMEILGEGNEYKAA